VLRLKLHQGHLLAAEALVTHPLCVNLLSQEVEGSFHQASAHSVEPKVAARFTKDCLVIVMNFFVADSARIDWRSIGILRVEDHGLV